jgi:hypothetical protein
LKEESMTDDPRWQEIHKDGVGIVLAVVRNDVPGFRLLVEPYRDRSSHLGQLLWDMGMLARALAKTNLEQSFEAHPDHDPMSIEDFFRQFAYGLKSEPPPDL